MVPLFISIVIPVLRDTQQLEELLEILWNQNVLVDPEIDSDTENEVIVVNGDTTDSTVQSVRERFRGIHWINSPAGRGIQMNEGAKHAKGKWLLFLHADTRLELGWVNEIRKADLDPQIISGAFRFSITSSTRAARLIERGVAWRVRKLGLPYGDQGLFVRRNIFEELGGYRSLALMEDIDLVHRLRRRGRMFRSTMPIWVSSRRWEQDGWVYRTFINLCLLGFYYAGVSPRLLARIYYGSSVAKDALSANQSVFLSPIKQSNELIREALHIAVIIPALNEEQSIQSVLVEIPSYVSSVVVVDNGSTDSTASLARACGVTVVNEPIPGYGRACLAGLQQTRDADIVVFLDADRTDYPQEISKLVEPIIKGQSDFVMGVRGGVGRSFSALFGTAICVRLINLLWQTHYLDLAPFRAIRRESLDCLQMMDRTWGWTIEMQVKAFECGLRTLELPVRQRPRIGQSKISGTVRGVVSAGTRMLITIWVLWRTRRERTTS